MDERHPPGTATCVVHFREKNTRTPIFTTTIKRRNLNDVDFDAEHGSARSSLRQEKAESRAAAAPGASWHD